MSPEMEAQARRWKAHPRFRWMPGMLIYSTWYSESFRLDCDIADHEAEGRLTNEAIPDLSDPATQGLLMFALTDGEPMSAAVVSGLLDTLEATP